MDPQKIQTELFRIIRTRVSEQTPLAETIAKVLGISTDSAYRRIRGEKEVGLEELSLLCAHFHISLDQLMEIRTGAISFRGQYLSAQNFRFEEYMISLKKNMEYMNGFSNTEFYYSCKDMPIFHHFHFREMAVFKWFFWLKTYFQFPEFSNKQLKLEEYPDELYKLDQEVLRLYNNLPSVEIWNIESMNILFRQIDFYRDARVFESDQQISRLYDVIEETWDHLEQQAALGYKFMHGDPERKPMGRFRMYFNEVLLGDNSMLVTMDGAKMAFMTHATINFMQTRDPEFCENMYQHYRNQMKRSTLISEVSEKDRSRFFRIIRDRIETRKKALVQ